jgi:hypothetical protein
VQRDKSEITQCSETKALDAIAIGESENLRLPQADKSLFRAARGPKKE